MSLTSSSRPWIKIFLCSLFTIGLVLLQSVVSAQPASPPTNSGLPEETLAGFVTQISDGLATKIQASTCPDAVGLLDKIKEASSKAPDRDSVIGKVLLDVKTNPKLKDIIIQKVSAPMLNKLLECNMVPLDLASPA